MAHPSSLTILSEGEPGTTEYRLRFKDDAGRDISPWHDIPLNAGKPGVVHAVIEIPKMTKAKFEVRTNEANNAIAQDLKKGKLREYHGPIYWNYGMLPQTWENPHEENHETRCSGDNDPLDVVEIGSQVLRCGSVEPVKALGVLAMIDDGELDWKVIAISVNDPLSQRLDDISDVERICPGTISGIREWFRWYKAPDGKPLNSFGFNEMALGRGKAMDVIGETHEAWKRLRDGDFDAEELWIPEGEVSCISQSKSSARAFGLHALAVASSGLSSQLRSKL